ncbi:MAG: hypothetical protein RTV72_14775 [Candidatus Thorarchaeota archaeon]
MKVEDGHVTYEIKDLDGVIQEGDLGPVANPYRQVKYLVIRMSRYSSYTMDDLRLHYIGLYAGLVTTVPDPVEADGTPQGLVDSVPETTRDDVDTTSSAIAELIDSWWELIFFWPTFFISMVETTVEAKYDVLVKPDLIGNTKVEKMDVVCLAAEGNTEEIGEYTGNALRDVVKNLVYSALYITPVLLFFGLKFLKSNSLNPPIFIPGIIAWWAGFIGYLSLVDYVYINGYEEAIECVYAMVELLILLIVDSGLKSSLISGFIFLKMILPGIIDVILMFAGITEILDCLRNLNAVLTFTTMVAIIISIWYLIKFATIVILEIMDPW